MNLRARLACPLLLFALLLGTSADARAQSACQAASAVCLDADSFLPHAGITRFASLGGTEPVPAGELSFGLITAYTSRPLSLRTASPLPTGTRFAAIDNQMTAHMLWAYGVSNKLHTTIVAPFTFYQDGQGTQPITGGETLRKQALRDLRFGVSYALIPRADAPLAGHARKPSYGLMARLQMSVPSGDRDAFSSSGSAVWLPSLSGDLRIGRWLFASEVSLRLRPARDLGLARPSSQIGISLGASWDVLPRDALSLFGETRALVSVMANRELWRHADGSFEARGERTHAPAEWALGVRSAALFGGDLALDFAIGSGFSLGSSDYGAPRLRAQFGVRYTPRLRDSDGDGVLDKFDPCPLTPGYVAPGSDAGFDGCVHHAPAPIEFGLPQDEPAASPSEPEAPQGEPAAPPSEPEAPQGEPAAPPSEPEAPQGEPAAPPSEPEAPQGEPAAPPSEPDPLK